MFYIKDNRDNLIEFTGEVYAQCLDCGKLHLVDDILEIIQGNPSFDFYGTNICCEDCSKKREQVRRMGC